MKVNKSLNLRAFLIFAFIGGFVFQPAWVTENFWSKAEFYESLPFEFPYILFLVIFSGLQTIFAYLLIKAVKKLF